MRSHTRKSHSRPDGAARRRRRRVCALLAQMLALTPLLFCVPARAEGAALDALDEFTLPRTLTRQSADSYDYYVYASEALPQGQMGGAAFDLDGDGLMEYVTVCSGADNAVSLQIYESDGGDGWTLSASTALYESAFDVSSEAHDVFLKPSGDQYLICNENWRRESAIADGAAWELVLYAYTGDALLTEERMHVEGTDITSSLQGWLSDPYYLENYPELQAYAQALQDVQLDVQQVYWNHMICEQDDSLLVLNRVYSGCDVSQEVLADFIASNGSELDGFFIRMVNCANRGLRLPEEHRLSNPPVLASGAPAAEGVESPEEDGAGQYVIADSDTRLLTAEELSQYDKATLALIRNEILARHGYPFQKKIYREYFESQPWYERDEDFAYSSLSSTEMRNVEVIKRLENQ